MPQKPAPDYSQLLDLVAIDRELGRRSLREYVQMAWPLLESVPYVHGWHIDCMTDHLEAVTAGQITDLLINIPPGCSKSLVTSVFWASWEWTREPGKRWLHVSYDQHLSTRDSLKTRTIIESDWYRARWPGVEIRKDQGEKTYYETTAGGWRLSTSIGGHGTGEHPDRIVVDDPHNVRKAESETERDNVKTWWDLTMSLRGISRGVRRVVIMQRLHESDLSGHILEKAQGFVHICLPMRYEPGRMVTTPLGWNDPRQKPGELLAPQQFPEKVVVEMEKILGQYGAAGQLQQRPAPLEGGLFKRADWRYWEVLPRRQDGTLEFDRLIQSWDMTFKDEEQNDYVVGQVWGRRGAEFWLLDQVRDRMDFTATCAAVRQLSAKWPQTTAKIVEEKGNGPAVISALRHTIPGLIPQKADVSTGGKFARAEAVSPLVAAHNIRLPANAPWVQEFISEHGSFPNATHDDQVDCLSQALAYLEPGAYAYGISQAEAAKKGPPPRNLEELRAKQFKEKVQEMLKPKDQTVPPRYKQV